MIVPKSGPGVQHFDGKKYILEWLLLSSRFDETEEQLSSLVCGEGILRHMMGSPPSLCSLWEMGIL